MALTQGTVGAALKDVAAIAGGILGTIAFFWKVWEALVSYVSLSISASPAQAPYGPRPTLALSVTNTGILSKRITYAGVLLGPPDEALRDVAHRVLGSITESAATHGSHNSLATLVRLRRTAPVATHDRLHALLPLPFYFEEQRHVGNERITFRLSLPDNLLIAAHSYQAVFFVAFRHAFGLVRFRVVADLCHIA